MTLPEATHKENHVPEAAIPNSGMEARMDVPPGHNQKKSDNDNDDYDSSSYDSIQKKTDDKGYDSSSYESDDEDDVGRCYVWMVCVCFISTMIFIIPFSVELLRRRKVVEPTLTPTMMPTVSPTTALPTMTPASIGLSPTAVDDSFGHAIIGDSADTNVSPNPTLTPASTILSWTTTVDNVRGPELSQFGSAIALAENFYAVGAPRESAAGAVFTALFEDPHWNLLPVLHGEDQDDNFGEAVGLWDGYLIVGAPNRKANGTPTMVGEAYLYSFQPNTGRWLKVGSTLKGDEDIFSAGGEFGKAVAIGVGQQPRVVVGAPKHSKDADSLVSGRVYTFELTGQSWTSLDTSKPLFGKRSNDLFGAAVDITNSGNRLIVGAPGANEVAAGYVQIFEWDGSQWVVDFEVTGESGDNFGTTVVALADTDDVFIVGAPGHQSGRGKIVAYRRPSPNTYIRLGPDIVGDVNDSLGRSGSVTGGLEDGAVLLVFATLDGEVRTFTFDDSSNTWLQRALPLATGYGAANVDYAEENGLLTSNSDEDKVQLYEASDVAVASIDSFAAPRSLPIKYRYVP